MYRLVANGNNCSIAAAHWKSTYTLTHSLKSEAAGHQRALKLPECEKLSSIYIQEKNGYFFKVAP